MTLGVAWTYPAALWALLLALPIAAFSLYRLKRRRVVVPFLPLLQESTGGARAQAGWRRLTEVGSLVARVLALAAVVFALAGPKPDDDGAPPRSLVVVLDADVTTSAKESPTETRFQRQVALAKAYVRAHPRGPISVLRAGVAPQVLVAATDDREAAARALDGLAPEPGSADLAPTLAVAADLAARPPAGRVLVVSSRALPQSEKTVPMEAVGAGIASDDVGFVDQAITPAKDGVKTTVRWTIKNFSRETRERRVEALWTRDRATSPAWTGAVTVDPGSTVDVTFDLLPPRTGSFLEGRLQGPDAFERDDRTLAWLEAPRRPSVLVVHGGTVRPFVTAVLDALGDSIDREASGSVTATDFPKAQRRDVTVIDGVAVPRVAVPWSRVLFLAPVAGADLPFRVGETVAKPLVWRVDAAHPLLRGVDLSTAFVARAAALEGEGIRGLAFADSAVVVAEGGRSPGWIAFGLDPDGSDLPLRAALPVLVRNAIRILGARPDAALAPFYRSGDPMDSRLEPTQLRVSFSEPSTRESTSSAPLAGLRAPPGGPFAAFVTDERQGNPSDWGADSWTAVIDLDPARDITPVRPPSPAPPPAPDLVDPAPRWRALLLLAAFALLVLDLVLVRAARRRIVSVAATG